MIEARITAEQFETLAVQGVPYVGELGCRLVRLEAGAVEVAMPATERILRPGGTVCGPAMMGLADITLYAVVLSLIGPVPLAVTTDLTLHFLKRPQPDGELVARGRILKLGRRLAIGEVMVSTASDPEPVCHVVGTYAIPPEASAHAAPPTP